MAKIFDLGRFFAKRKSSPSLFTTEEDATASETKRRAKILPMSVAKDPPVNSWPASSSRASPRALGALLLVIGVLFGLYLGRADRNPAASQVPPDTHVSTASAVQPAAAPARPLSKPSPMIPAVSAQGQGAAGSGQGSVFAPSPRPAETVPVARYLTTRFEATHKKAFGGCTGQLELTATGLLFHCPDQPNLDLPVDEIAKAHKDGVMLKSGEKYHFAIANRTKDQAEAIFISWLSRVQPSAQAGRTAF